jgi:hypothetical protein
MSKALRETVRLVMHMSEGYSRVILESTEGMGMAYGGVCWEIPTERIPQHLRAIGSRFVVTAESPSQAEVENMTPQELRATLQELKIEEIPSH